MVQSLDFFTNGGRTLYFGQTAAQCSFGYLLYGGQVKTALNIVCFLEKINLNILGKILEDCNDKILEAGWVTRRGHSIADIDVKYSLSVKGIVTLIKFTRIIFVKKMMF